MFIVLKLHRDIQAVKKLRLVKHILSNVNMLDMLVDIFGESLSSAIINIQFMYRKKTFLDRKFS